MLCGNLPIGNKSGVNGCINGFNYRAVMIHKLSIKWVKDSFMSHSVFMNFE